MIDNIHQERGTRPIDAKREAANAAWRDVVQTALEKDIRALEGAIASVDFDDEVQRFKWPLQVKRWFWHEKYYKGLAAYCKKFAVRMVLELGTCTGASSVCLSKFSENVVTCDLTDWSVADLEIFGEKIKFVKSALPTDVLYQDFSSFDLLFVDIDHSGLLERLVHLKLRSEGYQGDAFYDDIEANAEMKRFWESIDEPKMALDWHSSGFGVVRYGGGHRTAVSTQGRLPAPGEEGNYEQ